MLWWVVYQESDKRPIRLEDMLGISFLIQFCRTPPFASSKMLCMRKQTHIWFIDILLLLRIYKLYNAPCSLFVVLKPNTCIVCQRIIVGIQVCFTLLTKLTKMSISKRWFFSPHPFPYHIQRHSKLIICMNLPSILLSSRKVYGWDEKLHDRALK